VPVGIRFLLSQSQSRDRLRGTSNYRWEETIAPARAVVFQANPQYSTAEQMPRLLLLCKRNFVTSFAYKLPGSGLTQPAIVNFLPFLAGLLREFQIVKRKHGILASDRKNLGVETFRALHFMPAV
jgi:hypothetical protein